MKKTSDMYFFVLLVQKSSISGAALELGVSPAAVSKRLSRLEERLSVRLLRRTTRNISLTNEGYEYFNNALKIIKEIESLELRLAQSRDTPVGILRVNASFGFGRAYIAKALSEYALRYPQVGIQLILSSSPLNLVDEAFDVGVRFGPLSDSRLIAKKIKSNKRILCASPDYLQTHGTPTCIDELKSHNCIVIRQENVSYENWQLSNGRDQFNIKVNGQHGSNDGETAIKWAVDGVGIILRSEWDVERYIKSGELKVVLPEYFQDNSDIYAVFPDKYSLSAKVKKFIDILISESKNSDIIE